MGDEVGIALENTQQTRDAVKKTLQDISNMLNNLSELHKGTDHRLTLHEMSYRHTPLQWTITEGVNENKIK